MTVRKASFLTILAIAIAGAIALFAGGAFATPNEATTCSSCHTGTSATLSVTATKTSSTATTTTYSVAVKGGGAAVGWGVFNGSTKVAGADGSGATGTFTVNNGSTYTVYGVDYAANATNGAHATTTVSPAATTPTPTPSATPTQTGTDTTPPVTTSNVNTTTPYSGKAVITLTATDTKGAGDTGCWGVQYIYYKIDPGTANDGNPCDGGPAVVVTLSAPAFTGTCTVTVTGPAAGQPAAKHTIEFWAQDAAGNVETPTTQTFTVAAVPIKARLSLKLSGLSSGTLKLGRAVTAKGRLTPTSLARSKVKLTVQRKVSGKWRSVKSITFATTSTGTYKHAYKPTKKGSYRIRVTIAKTAKHTAAASKWRTFRVK